MALAIGMGIIFVLPLLLAPFLLVVLHAWMKGRAATLVNIIWSAGLIYLLLSALWPRYVAFFLPGLPSINATRIANIVMVVFILYGFASTNDFRNAISESFKKSPWIFSAFATFLLIKLASVFSSISPFQSGYQFLNESYVHFLCLPLGIYIAQDRDRLLQLSKYLFYVLVIVAFVGILEYVLKKNLFASFVDPTNDYVAFAVSEKTRGGVYRAQSTLGYPIVYGEYMVLAFCLATYYLSTLKSHTRFLLEWFGFLLVLISSYICGSRSAIVAALLVFIYLCLKEPLINFLEKNISLWKLTRWVFASAVLSAVVIVLTGLVYDRVFGAGNDQQSNQLRQMMVQRSFEVIQASPLLGYGVGNAPQVVGISTSAKGYFTLDSYYLSILVDSGIPAFFLFIALHLLIGWQAIKIASVSGEKLRRFLLGIFLLVMVSLFYKSILSQLDNHYIFFLVAGITLGLLAKGKALQDYE